MPRNLVILALLISLLTVAGCAKSRVQHLAFSQENLVHVSEMHMAASPAELTSMVAYLEPGDRIPFAMHLESDWLELDQNQNISLVVKQPIYLRMVMPKNVPRELLEKPFPAEDDILTPEEEAELNALFAGSMLYASADGVQWAPLHHIPTLQKVFGIQGGDFSLGMGVNTIDGPWASVEVILHQQEQW
ncbi:hypothetical protein [Desulfonatronum parangueonense]